MNQVGQYRNSLLNITDEQTRPQTNRCSDTPRITAKFYRGQDINIVLSDLESLGALYAAIERALEHATSPNTSGQFRGLTVRVLGDANRVTVTLAGYVATRQPSQDAA